MNHLQRLIASSQSLLYYPVAALLIGSRKKAMISIATAEDYRAQRCRFGHGPVAALSRNTAELSFFYHYARAR